MNDTLTTAPNPSPSLVISHPEQRYCGWPTILRLRNGELLVVTSGNRDGHLCPNGRIQLLRSSDEGRTWSKSVDLTHGPIDDRDPGIVEAADGSVVVTWFTSLAFAYFAKLPTAWEDTPEDREKRAFWLKILDSYTTEEFRNELGHWAIRSTDGGITWSERYRLPVTSPHGPARLSDGRLLYAGKATAMPEDPVPAFDSKAIYRAVHRPENAVAESRDNGKTWQVISAKMPPGAPGQDPNDYHEFHQAQAADGRIVVHIRNHNEGMKRQILQTESFDGGKTWTMAHDTGLWGFPAHLLLLGDGRLLTTYSHRRDPVSIRAAVSTDHGETWSDPIHVADAPPNDFGYPSTAELPGGELLTLWYGKTASSQREAEASLFLNRWRLE